MENTKQEEKEVKVEGETNVQPETDDADNDSKKSKKSRKQRKEDEAKDKEIEELTITSEKEDFWSDPNNDQSLPLDPNPIRSY